MVAACATAAARLLTPSRSKMFSNWVRMVPSERWSRLAIWRLVRACPTRASNCVCRVMSWFCWLRVRDSTRSSARCGRSRLSSMPSAPEDLRQLVQMLQARGLIPCRGVGQGRARRISEGALWCALEVR
jgi:hypothetical protein